MNPSGKPDVTAKSRLQAARMRSGLDVAEIARVVGISNSSYYDLEDHDHEIEIAIDLINLFKIVKLLGVSPSFILVGQECSSFSGTAKELVQSVRAIVKGNDPDSLERISRQVGWDLCIYDSPQTMLSYPVDAIKDVCKLVQMDWNAVIEDLFHAWLANENRA